MPPPPTEHRQAFSLIELLVVMAVIGLLAAVTVSAFNAIAGAHGVSQGAYELSGFLELARSEAVARQTYVWVGVITTNVHGGSEVRMAAVCSRDGSANASPANLMNLIKVLRLQSVVLTNWGGLKPETRNVFSNGVPQSVATNSSGIAFSAGTSQFAKSTLTFTPRGEAMLMGSPGSYDGYPPYIDISIRQAHGTVVTDEADDASVVVDGATGSSTMVQLQ